MLNSFIFYYREIVFLFALETKGIVHTISSIKDGIKDRPFLAASYIMPLVASLILGKLSYNYFKKDWNYKKSLELALSLDKTILTRLENAEQRN